jgi:release factor glutamine methyltransferase
MLSDILRCRATDLYLATDRVLDPADIATFIGHLERRGAREPLQYILGSTEFMALPFEVKPPVFIPRPDTEVLIEIVESRLRTPALVLDLCCGSGVIAVSLARRTSSVRAVAVDVCSEAIALASRNAARNEVGDRIRFIESNAMLFLNNNDVRFDAIVSNPPYIPTGDLDLLPPEVRTHEPPLSLDGGTDGLDFYRHNIPSIRAALVPGGLVAFEMGDSQGEAIGAILKAAGFDCVEVHRDYAGRERVITATNGSNREGGVC